MRYYIDCEFEGHEGQLLSMALVDLNGRGLHYGVTDILPICDPWVLENVVPVMGKHGATLNHRGPKNRLGQVLADFIGPCECPIITADSPVDVARFCRAISTDLNGCWQSTNYPKIEFEVYNVDCYPTQLAGAVQHNAWWDAMALKDFLERKWRL
jgi:hypothetical protein